jgi:2-isopropylmalate synthase
MDSPRITIFDTTLRDGEQSPGCSMNVQEKVRLARQLDRLGVDVIEAGFPIASDGDFAAVQAVAAAVPRPVIAALARAARHDIERASQALGAAVRPRIHVFLATSDIHLQHKLLNLSAWHARFAMTSNSRRKTRPALSPSFFSRCLKR